MKRKVNEGAVEGILLKITLTDLLSQVVAALRTTPALDIKSNKYKFRKLVIIFQEMMTCMCCFLHLLPHNMLHCLLQVYMVLQLKVHQAKQLKMASQEWTGLAPTLSRLAGQHRGVLMSVRRVFYPVT